MVDSTRHQWLEFAGRPIPNQMQGQWPTRKLPGKYEVDVILTAANFEPQFVTFQIDFKGGTWPAPGASLDAMYTAKFLRQGKQRPKHPVVVSRRNVFRWLGIPVWWYPMAVA